MPEEIAAEVSEALEASIEIDAGRVEELGAIEEFFELDAGAAEAGSPSRGRAVPRRRRLIGDGVRADPAQEVPVGGEKSA